MPDHAMREHHWHVKEDATKEWRWCTRCPAEQQRGKLVPGTYYSGKRV